VSDQELSESGAGDEVLMSIAGHLSRAMLSRYSPCGWKRNGALDEIATRQNAAGERRLAEAELQRQIADMDPPAAVVQ